MSLIGRTSQSFSGFSPTSIPDCVLWLDATDSNTLTLSGTNVTAWQDKSGFRNHSVATNGTRTYSSTLINNRPGILFDNSPMRGDISGTITAPRMQCFMVATPLTSGAYARFFVLTDGVNSDAGSVQSWTPFINYDSVMAVARNSAYRQITTSITSNNPNLLVSYVESSGIFITPNGTATFAAANSGTTGNLSISRWVIGGNEAGNTTWDPRIRVGEILVYSNVLSSNVRYQIEGYLTAKWGLTSNLPVTHPLRNARSFMRPFVPVDISGCALWLDGLDPSGTGVRPASGTTISTWFDKSGGGRNATAGGTTPIYSNSMVNFNGNGYLINTAFTYSLQNRSVFIVASQTASSSASAFEGIFVLGATGGGYDYADVNSCVYHGRGGNPNGNGAFGVYLNGDYNVTYLNNSTPAPFAVYSDVFGSNSGTIYANGSNIVTDTTTGTIGNGTGYLVGARYYTGPTSFLFGGVSEIIMYRTALTAGQRQQVETYLANKWGLRGSTPAGHYARLAPALTPQFNPLLIGTCRLWLDGADATAVSVSGSNVTQWTDRSGNGFNFTLRSGDRNPVYTSNAVNGLNALSFTGSGGENATDMMLRNTSISVNVSAYSIFAVARQNASSPSPYGANYILGTVSGSPLLYGTYTGGNFITSVGSTGSFNDLTVNSPNTQLKTTSVTGMVVNGSTMTPYINGTAMSTKNGTTGSYTGMDIGASGGGQTWQGFICEILIFNSAITTTERQFVEGYLANKWGTTTSLAGGHPFKTAKP